MDNDFYDDPEFQELIKDYIAYLNELVIEISESIKTGKFDNVNRMGHNIKGSGGGYGFSELTEIGREIEFGAKESDIKKVNSGVEKLKTFLANH